MLIFILLLLHIPFPSHSSPIKCSPSCTSLCSIHQLSCVVCLAKYYQTMDSLSLACQCMEDFKPFHNYNTTYCCPIGCRSCDLAGCSQCWTSASVVYNQTLKANTCQCRENYEMDSEGICSCSSFRSPLLFYYDGVFQQCMVCPKGCVCDVNGCS